MTKSLKALVVEDSEDDFELLVRELELQGYAPSAARVETPEAMSALSLRVLLSSGYTDEKSMWPIIQKKGYPMLNKPYPIADLLKAVRDILGGNS